MPEYGTVGYWDNRYIANNTLFDWYLSYRCFRDDLLRFLPSIESSLTVLVLGCGNSRLSEGLYADGFEHQMNIDISGVVIDQMRERYSLSHPNMKFLAMDATKLDFPSESFDVVIDKGTLDSILCSPDYVEDDIRMTKEIFRVLRPGGRFIMISYGVPESRLEYIQRKDLKWTVQHVSINTSVVDGVDDSSQYHMYIAEKSLPVSVPVDVDAEDDDDDDDQYISDLQSRIRAETGIPRR